jgi:hypothetical protein
LHSQNESCCNKVENTHPGFSCTKYFSKCFSFAIAEASSSTSAQLPSGLKLVDPSELHQPGNKDGQIKVVSEHGGGMAYSWNAAEFVPLSALTSRQSGFGCPISVKKPETTSCRASDAQFLMEIAVWVSDKPPIVLHGR